MESRIRSDQAYQIRQKCFSRFEELVGFYPKTLKQRILALLIYDFDWWSMRTMVMVLSEATSISQRIGEMIRDGIEFDQKHDNPQTWYWKLITSSGEIDFKVCALKPQQEPAVHRPFAQDSNRLPALPPFQVEIAL